MHDQLLKTTRQVAPPRTFSASSETALHTVADVDSLLARSQVFFGASRISKVVLHLPELSAREARETEVRLNAWARDCGCNAGGVGASLALVSYVGFLLATVGSVRQWRLGHVLWGAVVCLMCALAGKVIGLVRARVRLTQQLLRLRAQLQAGTQLGGD